MSTWVEAERRIRRALAICAACLCGCEFDVARAPCERDGDCGDAEVCYVDDRCAPRDIAERAGGDVGDECVVEGGVEQGCAAGVDCRMGFCGGHGGHGGPGGDGGTDAADARSDGGDCTTVSGTPLFGGATAALSDGADAIVVQWLPAADDASPTDLEYLVFAAASPGAEDFAVPTTTAVGVTSVRLTGLVEGTTFYFVVRVRDPDGHVDCNTNEVSATPQGLSGCIDFATQVQTIFTDRCIACHSGPDAPQGLHLDSYAGALAGGLTGNEVVGCQPEGSLLYLKVSLANPPVGVRMPKGGPYLTETQIQTLFMWIDQGARASCSDPDPCTDASPPTFSGLESALLTNDTTATLCWSPATDDTTAAGDIVYDVYEASGPGGQDFSTLPTDTSDPGAICIDRAGLVPGATYCWVVRARDAAGNRDANTVEICQSTPLASCIEYATVIQPIFDVECTHCHAGPMAPQNLHLDTYAGVLAGGLTGGEIIACQPDSSLLYLKISQSTPPVGARMPFDGPPYLTDLQISTIAQWISEGARQSCADPDPCADTMPPTFAGLQSAALADDTTATLCWSPAADDVTPVGDIVYDVYEAPVMGGQDFGGLPAQTSASGATCLDRGGLVPGATYCWVVRARDAAGNRDANTTEICQTAPAASCIDYATMVQPIFSAECTHCHSGTTPPRDLHLDSYAGVMAGGQTGSEIVSCQPPQSLLYLKITMDTPPVGARMPFDGPPYLNAPQIATIEQWIAEGARASCADPDPCSDAIPPVFGGVTTVTALDATRAELCWTPGSDDTTAQSDLVYDAYQATASGGEDFSALPRTTSDAGATCTVVDALGPGDPFCFVVRARDLAGNRDANLVEQCTTQPALPAGCVEYDTMIQPLFDANCTRCHSGPSPPQWLRLDSYDNVLSGSVRRNEIEPCDSAASLLIGKVGPNPPLGRRMPWDGPPYLSDSQIAMLEQWVTDGAPRSCAGPTNCGDITPPVFPGLTTVTALDETTVEVCWAAASDDSTAPESIRYDLYQAGAPGGEALTEPPQTTVMGQTCATVRAGPGTNLCFVVRAQDLTGNRDANITEACASTPAATCAVEFDALIAPILEARCKHCHSGAEAPRFLDVSTYAGVLAGGSLRDEVAACDWAQSRINLKTAGANCGQRMPRDGPPWLSTAERSLLRRWIESGARRSCNSPAPCGDSTAPTFVGATSATALDGTTARVCWDPAVDDTTASGAIVYEIYEAASPGGERFSAPASYAVADATCLDIPVPTGVQSCYVVRARDLGGNLDGNTLERCMTTPAACFDYADLIQPLFDVRCVHCHSGPGAPRGIRWDTYANAIADPDEVVPCDRNASKLYDAVTACDMPRDTSTAMCATEACLTPSQRRLLTQWIDNGAEDLCPWTTCP